jgi:hypothetical protein
MKQTKNNQNHKKESTPVVGNKPNGKSRMIMLKPLLQLYAGRMKRHPVVLMLVVFACILLIWEGLLDGMLGIRIAHIVAFALGVFILDCIYIPHMKNDQPILVSRPKKDLIIATFFFLAGASWLFIQVSGYANSLSGFKQIGWGITGIVLVNNIGLGVFFMVASNWRFQDLGFRFQPSVLALPLIFVFAVVSRSFGTWHDWNSIVHTFGSPLRTLLTGLFVAALPEEFFRFVWQTRLAGC